jgi:hypothetical protein
MEVTMVDILRRRRRLGRILLPVLLLWKVLGAVVALVGRRRAMIIGALAAVAGALVSLTVIGAVVGVPLALVGIALVVRAFLSRR